MTTMITTLPWINATFHCIPRSRSALRRLPRLKLLCLSFDLTTAFTDGRKRVSSLSKPRLCKLWVVVFCLNINRVKKNLFDVYIFLKGLQAMLCSSSQQSLFVFIRSSRQQCYIKMQNIKRNIKYLKEFSGKKLLR